MAENIEQVHMKLTALMFEAAADPNGDGWPEVYQDLSKQCGAGSGSLYVLDKRETRFLTLADTHPTGFIEEVNRKYFDMVPYKANLLAMKTGDIFRRCEAMSDVDFERTDIYRECLSRAGVFHSLHFCLFEGNDTAAGVNFARPKSRGDFTPETIEAVAPVMPMLERALKLHSTVVEASENGRLSMGALDRISQGVVIVNGKGKVHYANTSAEKLLAAGKGIRTARTGTLECDSRADTEKLKALLKQTIEPSSIVGKRTSGVMRLRGPRGEEPVSLLVTPMQRTPTNPFSPRRYAAVLISERTPPTDDIRRSLSEVFGLTSTEATIAALLAFGRSMPELCGELEITENTARTHLKRIFAKTDTNRQSSLVRTVLSLPWSVD